MLLAAALVITAPTPAPVSYENIPIGSKEYLKVVARVSEFPMSDKFESSLAVAPNGSVGIAWQSRRQLNGHSGVYTREFSRMGLSQTSERRGGAVTGFHESKPSIVFGDRFVPIHESAWRDDSGGGVFVGASAIPETTRGDQSDVATSRFPDGRILAVWSSQISRNERRLFGRVLDRSGKPIGSEFRITFGVSDNELLPSVAVRGGEAVVAWQSMGKDGKLKGVWVQKIAMGSIALPTQVAPAGVEPSLAGTPDGYVLGWAQASDSGYEAKAALMTENLEVRKQLALPNQSGYQNATAVASGLDSIAVAWNLADGANNKAVWLAKFSLDGRSEGSAVRLHAGSLAEATGRQRIAFSGGTLCLTWSGDAGLGDSKAVHATFLTQRASVTSETLAALAEASAVPVAAQPVRPTSEGASVQFAEEAGPHEPPSFNPNARLDPWGLPGTDSHEGGFTAVVSTGWTPPDPHMAVGPNHVGVMTNGQIAFFTKDGTNVFRDEIEDNFGFWGALGTTNFVFDPEIIYDDNADRWMAMACERGSNGRSYFLLAVSDDDNPTGNWFKYRLDVTTQGGGSDIDSPNLATDDECVYLSADFFTPNQKYLVFILKKSDVMAGNPTPLTRHHLITGTQSHGLPMTYDAAAPQYLIEHFEATSNTTVRLHAITDPLGTPTRTTFTLAVPTYGRPENPPQAGTSTRPTAFDSRFWSCVFRNGSLWATHHINSSRVLARWYEIRMNNWPNGGSPELVQSGEIDPGGTVRTSFSSIAVDPNGNAAVVCARSSPTEFLSMYRAVRKSDDPLGTMPEQAILKASDGPYFTSRWGDYSAVAVDPVDNRTFWAHHEYSVSGLWHTWVGSFAPEPDWVEEPVQQIIPINAGTIVGGLPELGAVDNSVLSVGSTPNPPTRTLSSIVDYTATADPGTLVELEVRCVAKSGAGLGFAQIALLNRQTGLYDAIGTELVGMGAYSTFTFHASFDVNRYVNQSNREIRMRMTFNLGPQPSTFRPPILIDEIKFRTGY